MVLVKINKLIASGLMFKKIIVWLLTEVDQHSRSGIDEQIGGTAALLFGAKHRLLAHYLRNDARN